MQEMALTPRRIAVDGMGGDYAPGVVVQGAAQAVTDFDLEIVLVGQEQLLKRELAKHKIPGGRITVHHASQVVDMGESPVQAIRKKKDSSVAVCIDLLKQKAVDAVVTAGNTGAAVAASTLNLGLLPGIKRPGIVVSIPTLHGISLAIDVGANVDPTPEHLFQYALMGDIYSRSICKKRRPAIGLLNVGEEESKGTTVTKEAYKLLRESDFNFIGNIEGRDFFTGKCDVIVCDGFVGNIVLKLTEGLFENLVEFIKKELSQNYLAQLGSFLCKSALLNIRKEANYEEAGGGQLLGLNGVVIISHGSSTAWAIRNAIKKAAQVVEFDVNGHIVTEITQRDKSKAEAGNHSSANSKPAQPHADDKK
ncbi:MAG TPA: phosphate acyltransferase PlsX [Candidatus Omnitrophota bacterium]|nr:phosphate acyltransferase PlsX [Candidatus Omnitrophota bacterium]